jgi:hypothetical protein
MKNLIYLLLAFFIVVFAGCRYSPVDQPYFTVKSSALNWVEIRQYETGGRETRIRLRIDGNGVVNVRDGTSALVGNTFAANIKSENWDDIRENRISIPEEDVLLIFQSLVDAGLFYRPQVIPYVTDVPTLSTNETSLVYVTANINNKTVGSSDPVAEPVLLERLKLIVLTFYKPRPIRKQRQPAY